MGSCPPIQPHRLGHLKVTATHPPLTPHTLMRQGGWQEGIKEEGNWLPLEGKVIVT